MLTPYAVHRIPTEELAPELALSLKHFGKEKKPKAQTPEIISICGSRQALSLLNQLPSHGLAIVGTRYPQKRSVLHLQKVIRDLSGSNLVIVSGLAIGIDAAAHEAALEAGLPTVGILGGGLNRFYPEQNLSLAKKILDSGGLIVSEFNDEEKPEATNFLKRNRVIAGWSKTTWIAEAGYRSGALNTARWARELDRTCFATPCFPGDVALAGNQTLLDRDQARPIWNAQSLGEVWLELLSPVSKLKPPMQLLRSVLNESERLNLERLSNFVGKQTDGSGGAPVQTVLDWAIANDWSPQKFFFTLQKALEIGLLSDVNGLLLKNPSQSH